MFSSLASRPTDDGLGRFGRNVAFAWGGYMVNVISGFVVPRLISDQLGQVTLGVWDFAWSFVSYFWLVQLGMGSSISRYVSLYRARGDIAGLNQSVSTIAIFQRSVGWLALLLAVVSAWWILPLFGAQLGDALGPARWVLLFLGVEVAVGISLAAYPAVVVGCHRWDLHNAISAVAYASAAFAMVAVLLLGGRLPFLAFVHCAIMVLADVFRWWLVRRVCPELRIERRLAGWTHFKAQASYSVKILIPSISDLISNQALCLLITAFLGPAALAVFSRARGLMSTLRAFAVKFGMILVPTASALQAKNDKPALRATLLTTPTIISSLVLPVLITMGVLGDGLIRLWMGEAYVLHGLVAILCVGTYATLVQEPVWCLLAGMNLHGRIALTKLGAAVGSALLLTGGLWYLHWGLLGAAVCCALPQLLVDGLITPWYACRVLGVAKRHFLHQVYIRPICCILPFAIALEGAVMISATHSLAAFGAMLLGSLLSAWAYLRWLIALEFKKRVILLFRRVLPIRSAETCQ